MLAGLLLMMTAPPRVPVPRPEPVVGPAVQAPPLVTGAYAKADRTDPQVRAAYRAAVAALTPLKHPGGHLIAAESQVVAGTNYRLTLKLRDGSRWQAVVWHRLDGHYEVVATRRLD